MTTRWLSTTFTLFFFGVVILSGCDEVESITSELGIGESAPEVKPVEVPTEPKKLPEVPAEHVDLLKQMTDAAGRNFESKRFTDIGPQLQTGKFCKWYYGDIQGLKHRQMYVRDRERGNEPVERGYIEFVVNCFRSPAGYRTRAEAEASEVATNTPYQLAFVTEFEFEKDHWVYKRGHWGRAADLSKTEPFVPDTSHYKLVQSLFSVAPTLPGSEGDPSEATAEGTAPAAP